MQIIYIAGNSLRNKDWIEKVKSKFDSFSTGKILYYDHWTTEAGFIDFEKESIKLSELVKDMDEYCVFAKSVGTALALKTISEGMFKPKKAIFCGVPYGVAKKEGIAIDSILTGLSVPVIFVQNESDPVCSHDDLEKVLEKNKPRQHQLIKNAGNDTHSYEDYEQLEKLVKGFFL